MKLNTKRDNINNYALYDGNRKITESDLRATAQASLDRIKHTEPPEKGKLYAEFPVDVDAMYVVDDDSGETISVNEMRLRIVFDVVLDLVPFKSSIYASKDGIIADAAYADLNILGKNMRLMMVGNQDTGIRVAIAPLKG